MQITKLGHCCLVLEIDGIKIVTDPGSFTTAQNELTGIDVILITHEHTDHFHVESVNALVKNNPGATIVCNKAVAALIAKENISAAVTIVGDGDTADVAGIKIEGFGKDHAPIYGTMGLVENTGYMVAEKFYFPGDNFHQPHKSVDVLALPVAGPWMKIADAIDFAKAVQPRAAFGVHDGMINPNFRGFVGTLLKMFVPNVAYVALADGETKEF
jgi:L-ascorbate metabolism protein UlaG (beta-lactamase superfamily)